MSEVAKIRQMLVDELGSLRRQAEQICAAIAALDAADQGETPVPKAVPKTAVKKPVAKAPKVTSAKPKAKAAVKAAVKKNGTDTPLPTTPGEWFLDLFTNTPKSGKDILDAAVRKVGGKLSKSAQIKLKNRLSFNLTDLKKQGKIVATVSEDGRKNLYALAGA